MWTQAIDSEYCFWTNGVIYKLLRNEVYIGTVIANRYKVAAPGLKRTEPRPREEWIVVPNAHESLVSEDDFQRAQKILQKKKYFDSPELIFGKKVRCPACNHAMITLTKNNPRFKCGTAKLTDHYGCKSHSVLQSDLAEIVLSSIRTYAKVLMDENEVKLARLQKSKLSAKDVEHKIATDNKSIERLEASITRAFTLLVSDKISKDAFLHKKGVINDTIARKRSDIEKWSEQLIALTEGRSKAENAIAELRQLHSLESLNREIVELLIDKILIHTEQDIEIVWKGPFAGVN